MRANGEAWKPQYGDFSTTPKRVDFAQYRETATFTEINRHKKIPLVDAPGVIKTILDESSNNHGVASYKKIHRLIFDPGHPFQNAIAASLDNPETNESNEIFLHLRQICETTNPQEALISDDVESFVNKVMILGKANTMIFQQEYFENSLYGDTTISEQMKLFRETFEKYMGEIKKGLDTFPPDNADALLRFVDCVYAFDLDAKNLPPLNMAKPTQKIPKEMYEKMDEAYSEAGYDFDLNLVWENIDTPLMSALETMVEHLSAKDIPRLLNKMPKLLTPSTSSVISEAILDLFELADAHAIDPETISSEGVVLLTHYSISRNRTTALDARFFEDMFVDNEHTFVTDTISLPKNIVPYGSNALLSYLVSLKSPQAIKLMEKTQNLAMNNKKIPQVKDEWLLNLTLSKLNASGEENDFLTQFLSDFNFPHRLFRDILLDKSEGSISVTEDGKLHVSKKPIQQDAIPLYTSRFQEQPKVEKPTTLHTGPRYVPSLVPLFPTEQQPHHRKKREATHPQSVVQPERKEVKTFPSFQKPDERVLKEMKKHLSPEDVELVLSQLEEYEQTGKPKIEPLHFHKNQRAKMRINGVGSGIRIILEKDDLHNWTIARVRYRNTAYRNLTE